VYTIGGFVNEMTMIEYLCDRMLRKRMLLEAQIWRKLDSFPGKGCGSGVRPSFVELCISTVALEAFEMRRQCASVRVTVCGDGEIGERGIELCREKRRKREEETRGKRPEVCLCVEGAGLWPSRPRRWDRARSVCPSPEG